MSAQADVSLSLPATVLLLAFDPSSGALFALPRRRLRKTLGIAWLAERGGRRLPWTPWVARRGAVRELRSAGLIGRRRSGQLQLLDRTVAANEMRSIQRILGGGADEMPREKGLLVLLASAGILAKRLPRDQLRVAARRLRGIVARGETGLPERRLTGSQPLTESLVALGAVASLGSWDLVNDGGSYGGFDAGDGGAQ